MEDSAGIYRIRPLAGVGRRGHAAPCCRSEYAGVAIEDRSRTFNTERVSALELSNMLDVAATIDDHVGRFAARSLAGAHQRTDFPKRDDQIVTSAHSLAFTGSPMARARDRIPTRDDYSLASRRAGLWRGPSRYGGSTSPCRLSATVRTRSPQTTYDEFKVPCPKEWVVLDGLNYIKDRMDGTLVVPLVVPHGHLRQLRDDR